jgi:hypothetical protein
MDECWRRDGVAGEDIPEVDDRKDSRGMPSETLILLHTNASRVVIYEELYSAVTDFNLSVVYSSRYEESCEVGGVDYH